MNTTTSRGFIALFAGPVAAAGIVAGGLGVAAVAHASTTPGVTAKSGMVLSKEFIAQQQEHPQLMENLKAEEQKQDAMTAVESQENDQSAEPKAHVYTLKTSVHKKLG